MKNVLSATGLTRVWKYYWLLYSALRRTALRRVHHTMIYPESIRSHASKSRFCRAKYHGILFSAIYSCAAGNLLCVIDPVARTTYPQAQMTIETVTMQAYLRDMHNLEPLPLSSCRSVNYASPITTSSQHHLGLRYASACHPEHDNNIRRRRVVFHAQIRR